MSKAYIKTVFVLTLAGVAFSGYLSAIKLFTTNCAFNEPCPYFLGYPACWYGFVMFFVMFVVSFVGIVGKALSKTVAQVNVALSSLGILFAGYFAVPEIMKLFSGNGGGYALGLPTCVYGFIFYIFIWIVSVRYLRNNQ